MCNWFMQQLCYNEPKSSQMSSCVQMGCFLKAVGVMPQACRKV